MISSINHDSRYFGRSEVVMSFTQKYVTSYIYV